jgi:hypothetical protein
MTFVKGQGFVPSEAAKPVAKTKYAVTEIVRSNPRSDQKKVIDIAMGQGCPKHALNRVWRRSSG